MQIKLNLDPNSSNFGCLVVTGHTQEGYYKLTGPKGQSFTGTNVLTSENQIIKLKRGSNGCFLFGDYNIGFHYNSISSGQSLASGVECIRGERWCYAAAWPCKQSNSGLCKDDTFLKICSIQTKDNNWTFTEPILLSDTAAIQAAIENQTLLEDFTVSKNATGGLMLQVCTEECSNVQVGIDFGEGCELQTLRETINKARLRFNGDPDSAVHKWIVNDVQVSTSETFEYDVLAATNEDLTITYKGRLDCGDLSSGYKVEIGDGVGCDCLTISEFKIECCKDEEIVESKKFTLGQVPGLDENGCCIEEECFLDVKANCKTSLLTSRDVFDYGESTIANYEHSVYPPASLELDKETTSSRTLQYVFGYTGTYAIKSTAQIETKLSDCVTVCSSITSEYEIKIDCGIDLCDIAKCLKKYLGAFYKEAGTKGGYEEMSAVKKDTHHLIMGKWALLAVYRDQCDSECASEVHKELKELLNCDCECDSKKPQEIPSVTPGIVNSIGIDGAGCINVNEVHNGGHQQFTVSIIESCLLGIFGDTIQSSILEKLSSIVCSSIPTDLIPDEEDNWSLSDFACWIAEMFCEVFSQINIFNSSSLYISLSEIDPCFEVEADNVPVFDENGVQVGTEQAVSVTNLFSAIIDQLCWSPNDCLTDEEECLGIVSYDVVPVDDLGVDGQCCFKIVNTSTYVGGAIGGNWNNVDYYYRLQGQTVWQQLNGTDTESNPVCVPDVSPGQTNWIDFQIVINPSNDCPECYLQTKTTWTQPHNGIDDCQATATISIVSVEPVDDCQATAEIQIIKVEKECIVSAVINIVAVEDYNPNKTCAEILDLAIPPTYDCDLDQVVLDSGYTWFYDTNYNPNTQFGGGTVSTNFQQISSGDPLPNGFHRVWLRQGDWPNCEGGANTDCCNIGYTFNVACGVPCESCAREVEVDGILLSGWPTTSFPSPLKVCSEITIRDQSCDIIGAFALNIGGGIIEDISDLVINGSLTINDTFSQWNNLGAIILLSPEGSICEENTIYVKTNCCKPEITINCQTGSGGLGLFVGNVPSEYTVEVSDNSDPNNIVWVPAINNEIFMWSSTATPQYQGTKVFRVGNDECGWWLYVALGTKECEPFITCGCYIVGLSQDNNGNTVNETISEATTDCECCPECDDLQLNYTGSVAVFNPSTNFSPNIDGLTIDYYIDYNGSNEQLIVTQGYGDFLDPQTMIDETFGPYPSPYGSITPVITQLKWKGITYDTADCQILPLICSTFEVEPITCDKLPLSSISYDGPGGISSNDSISMLLDGTENFISFRFRAFQISDTINVYLDGTLIYTKTQGSIGIPGPNDINSQNFVTHLIDVTLGNAGSEVTFEIVGNLNQSFNTQWTLEVLSCCDQVDCPTLPELWDVSAGPCQSNGSITINISTIDPTIPTDCTPLHIYDDFTNATLSPSSTSCQIQNLDLTAHDCGEVSVTVSSTVNQTVITWADLSDYNLLKSEIQSIEALINCGNPLDIEYYSQIAITTTNLCGDGALFNVHRFAPCYDLMTWDDVNQTLTIEYHNEFLDGLCEDRTQTSPVQNPISGFLVSTNRSTYSEVTSPFVDRIRALGYSSSDTDLCPNIVRGFRITATDPTDPCNTWQVWYDVAGDNTYTQLIAQA